MKVRAAALGFALLVLAGAGASAQESMSMLQRYRPPPKGSSDTYIVTLSGSAQLEPSFPGSDKAATAFFPSLSFRRTDEPARFAAPDDGASISFIDDPSVRFGPVFRIQSGRYLEDDRRLYGLRKLDWDVESGFFLEYWPLTFLRARAEVRRGFREDTGFVGNVGVDVVQPLGAFTFSIGPRLQFGDDRYVDRYFGVRAAEAAINKIVTPYKADGGLYSVGALGSVTYRWNETWATTVYAGYNRLVRDAEDSPIVKRIGSPDQVTVGAKVSYSFSYTPSRGSFW